MIVSADEMREIEDAAFARGISAEELMENAGGQIAGVVQQFFPKPGAAQIFYGKGHNGGDALVAARHLAAAGWRISLHAQESDEAKLSALTRAKLDALGGSRAGDGGPPPQTFPLVVLDGLLGLGARGPLRDELRAFTRAINQLRRNLNAQVFAIDLPTGLDSSTGTADSDSVIADFTLTIGFAKRALIADSATNYVGRLVVLPLPQLEAKSAAEEIVATSPDLAPLLSRRKFESHKANYGRIGIVAGSIGFTGAAVLAARGALRGGAGLVSLYATADIQPILAAAADPEVMVKPIGSFLELLDSQRDVLAIGPGLGTAHADEILQLIERCESPMILDADALNVLARSKKMALLRDCAGPRLLTPHPGEMARLCDIGSQSRSETVRAFTSDYPVTLLLKGSRTIIGEKGRPLSYNTTGSPGMATGGMGDVLTGVLAALAGQGLALYDAARLGAWLCGRAAEIAIFHGGESEESLCATDISRHLGPAFRSSRERCP